jgi:hypothetical protein
MSIKIIESIADIRQYDKVILELVGVHLVSVLPPPVLEVLHTPTSTLIFGPKNFSVNKICEKLFLTQSGQILVTKTGCLFTGHRHVNRVLLEIVDCFSHVVDQ